MLSPRTTLAIIRAYKEHTGGADIDNVNFTKSDVETFIKQALPHAVEPHELEEAAAYVRDTYSKGLARARARYPEAKDFGRIKDFDQYKKEVLAALKAARKSLESQANLDSTMLPRETQGRASLTSRNLMSQLQGILTRDFQDLNIQVKQGVNAIPQVVFKHGERTFYADIHIPQERFTTAAMDSVMDRIVDIAKTTGLQDYEDQDGVHYNKKSRKDRKDFGLQENEDRLRRLQAKYGRRKTEATAVEGSVTAPVKTEDDSDGVHPDVSMKARTADTKKLRKADIHRKTESHVVGGGSADADLRRAVELAGLEVNPENIAHAREIMVAGNKRRTVGAGQPAGTSRGRPWMSAEDIAAQLNPGAAETRRQASNASTLSALRMQARESVSRLEESQVSLVGFTARLTPIGDDRYQMYGDISVTGGSSNDAQGIPLGVITLRPSDDLVLEYENRAQELGDQQAIVFEEIQADDLRTSDLSGFVAPRDSNDIMEARLQGGTMEAVSDWAWEPSDEARAAFAAAVPVIEFDYEPEDQSWMESGAPISYLDVMREKASSHLPMRTDLTR